MFQVMVVPISEASLEYAQQVRLQLRKAKLHVDVDATDRKMQKKVREAQLAQYNYILVRSRLLPLACPQHGSLFYALLPVSQLSHDRLPIGCTSLSNPCTNVEVVPLDR